MSKAIKFDLDRNVDYGDQIFRLQYRPGGKVRTIASSKDLGYLMGDKGVGKSTWIRGVEAAALSGKTIYNMQFDLGENEDMVVVDTELAEGRFLKYQSQVYDIAGLPKVLDPRHIAISLTHVDKVDDRKAELVEILRKHGKRTKLLILDRIDHFMRDPTFDHVGSEEFVSWLKKLAYAMDLVIIGIIHTKEGEQLITEKKGSGALGRRLAKAAPFGFVANKWIRDYELHVQTTKDGEVPPPIRARFDRETGLMETLDFTPF